MVPRSTNSETIKWLGEFWHVRLKLILSTLCTFAITLDANSFDLENELL